MKILVIRYSGLGDIVILLQTLKKLKNKYSNSQITLLTDKSNESIQKLSCNLIDDVITIDRKLFVEKKIFASLIEIKNLFFSIRKKFDLCIDFQNFGETATISYLVNAPIKIGAPKKDKYNYGYTITIKRDESGHRSQFFSRIAQVDDKLDFSKLCLNDEAIQYKKEIESNFVKNKKVIGLNIGSTQENRRWNEKNFAKLKKELENSFNIIIFIGPSEKKFKYAFDINSTFIEDVNLVKLSGAIATCDIIITNDTGPAHIAAALNVPTLTLFSTGVDENVGSLILKKDYVRKENINDITIEEIKSKINNLL